MKPILNIASKKLLLAIVNNMPQSLLLYGPNGVGLGTTAKYITEILNIKPIIILPEKDEKIDLIKGMITVDIIRRLYDETRTKTAEKRIIIIDYAERMTIQSQNSFLKLLEEPGINLYFILLTHDINKLLPTVLSRTEKLEIKPISIKQSEKLLDTLKITDTTKRSQLLFMANNLPAEISRLATDDAYFDCRSVIVRDARELLRGRLYQKLLIAQRYKDDREGTLILLNDTLAILKKSIIDNPNIDSIKHIDSILKAYERIETNGNIRLCLARMVV